MFFAILEYLYLVGFKIGDRLAFGVGNGHVDLDQVCRDLYDIVVRRRGFGRRRDILRDDRSRK